MFEKDKIQVRPTAQFPKKESVGPREWGLEELLVHSKGNYTMKLITTFKGKKGGLQYHQKKDEANYIISGQLKIRYENASGKLEEKIVGPNEWFHFPTGSVHQEEAITDVVRIEVSTPYFNDRVRVEKQFGLDEDSGLPSTTLEEIVKG